MIWVYLISGFGCNSWGLISVADRHGLISKVNENEYLARVVAGEMPLHWPIEALKAQGIVSLNYLKSKMNRQAKAEFVIRDGVEDQVMSKKFIPPSLYRLLEPIRDLKVLDGEQILETYYHSDCGGETELPKEVWGTRNGSYSRVTCPYNNFRWELVTSLSELSAILKIKAKSIKISAQSPSGRASYLDFETKTGMVRLSGQQFREKVGYVKLKSTLFEMKYKGSQIIFSGRGFGHGVGLCQYGARMLALKGLKAQEIVEFYFPKAQLAVTDVASQ